MSADSTDRTNPSPPFVATAPARAVLKPLEQGLGARPPFLVLTGVAGSGKSTLLAELIRRWGERVTRVDLPKPAPDAPSLAGTLLALFGGTLKPGMGAVVVQERLVEALANATAGGRVALLVADDAHALSVEQLGVLADLAALAANRQCPLEVALVGLPSLDARLAEPALAALAQRIAVRAHVQPLSVSETREYLLMRPHPSGGASAGMYSRKACRDIHHVSRGVLGVVEALASESLRRALRAGATTVSPEHVRAAAGVLRQARPKDAPPAPVRTAPAAAAPAQPARAPQQQAQPRGQQQQQPAQPARGQQQPAQARAQQQAQLARPQQQPQPARAQQQPAQPARAQQSTPARANGNAPATAAARAGAAPAKPPQVATPVAEATATDGESLPSDDPRVKEWVARFGGAGVRIGGQFMEAAPRSERYESEEGASEPEPAAASAAPGAAPAAPARKLIIDESVREGAITAVSLRRAVGPVLPPRRHGVTLSPALMGLLVVFAFMAIAIGQRHALGAFAKRTLASLATHAPATAVAPAAPGPAAAAPTPEREPEPEHNQYAISEGEFPSREMAFAERDYLRPLLRYRVHAGPVGGHRGYRLLVGRFDDRASAESALKKLQARGLLTDAWVTELKRRPTKGRPGDPGTP